MFEFLKNLIAPKKCYSCKKLWHFLCEDCAKKLHNYKSYCYICKKESPFFEIHKACKQEDFYLDKIIVFTHYKNSLIKKLIKDAKYYWKKDILSDFSLYLSDLLKKNIDENSDDYILISRPMFFLKKVFRWYNQADILAKHLSKKTSIVYYDDLIKKIKYTKSQSKLDRQNRQKNLENSFSINKKYENLIKWKKIIIVDDVVSTWSTLNEIAKILNLLNPKEIIWLTIASD